MVDIVSMAIPNTAKKLESKPFSLDILKEWTSTGSMSLNSVTQEEIDGPESII